MTPAMAAGEPKESAPTEATNQTTPHPATLSGSAQPGRTESRGMRAQFCEVSPCMF